MYGAPEMAWNGVVFCNEEGSSNSRILASAKDFFFLTILTLTFCPAIAFCVNTT